jgi:hypothetical protein
MYKIGEEIKFLRSNEIVYGTIIGKSKQNYIIIVEEEDYISIINERDII